LPLVALDARFEPPSVTLAPRSTGDNIQDGGLTSAMRGTGHHQLPQ
jgi:hypothetical protein